MVLTLIILLISPSTTGNPDLLPVHVKVDSLIYINLYDQQQENFVSY